MSFLNTIGKFAAHILPTAGAIGAGILDYRGQNSANQANRDIANSTNITNANIAQAQQIFQEHMANTSWQRGVADMKLAGINPMLAVSQGGAASPTGASIAAQTGAPMVNPMSRVSQAIASAKEATMFAAQLRNLNTQTRKSMSDISLNNTLAAKQLADTTLSEYNARAAKINAENLKLSQAGLRVESDIDKSAYGKIIRYSNRSAGLLSSAISAKKAFTPQRSAKSIRRVRDPYDGYHFDN